MNLGRLIRVLIMLFVLCWIISDIFTKNIVNLVIDIVFYFYLVWYINKEEKKSKNE